MFEFGGSADQTVGAFLGGFCPRQSVDRLEFQSLNIMAKPLDLGATIAACFHRFTLTDLSAHPRFFSQFEAGLQSRAFTLKFVHAMFRLFQALTVSCIDDQGPASLNVEGILACTACFGTDLGSDAFQSSVEPEQVLKPGREGCTSGF